MILFNSDLDNTLIYSYKRDIGKDKYCVEIYQEREISFMSKTSYELLKKVNEQVCFVPTTTRTKEQYERINLGVGVPNYALICNGGLLLVDGVSDEEWYQTSLDEIKDSSTTLEQAIQLLEEDENRSFEIRFIEQLFVFTKSEHPEQTIQFLISHLNNEFVDIFHNGTKVYVVPKKLNKGNAIKRLKERLDAKKVIATGDSEFDVSMLQVADVAFAPKDLELSLKDCQCDHIIIHEGNELFSDRFLKSIQKMTLK